METSSSNVDTAMQNDVMPMIVRKNILLVEDYAPNALVASTMLDMLGYDCDIAANGIEGLKKFENGHYDLVLMDIQMPIMDGLETTGQIRALEKNMGMAPIPIIAMTAQTSLDFRMRCASAGMNGFIPKPFDPAGFAQLLEDFMSPDPSAN